jgi:hypothetical protein
MSHDSETDDFRRCCAATGSVELEITGPDESQTERRTFAQPSILLGCDAQNDVLLHGPAIKPHHAYLQALGGRVFYVNLARDGDTQGNRAARCGWLILERPFQVGEYSIRLLSNPGQRAQTGTVPRSPLKRVHADADLARQALYFEFVEGRSSRVLWRMNRVLTLIGRARGCKAGLPTTTSQTSKARCSTRRLASGSSICLEAEESCATANRCAGQWSRMATALKLAGSPCGLAPHRQVKARGLVA